jgi:hypothetical protein
MAYGAFTSKLTAVNQMLSTIGQSRVSTLVGISGEAADALLVLEEIDKDMQVEGWHFNQFYAETLARGTALSPTVTYVASSSSFTCATPTYLTKGETVTFGTTDYVVNTIAPDTKSFSLTPNSNPGQTTFKYSKRVATPSNALSMDVSDYRYADIDPIVRGAFLYDKAKASYEFTTDLKVTITYLVAFEQSEEGEPSLPEYARRYIIMKAARVFAQRYIGDPQLIKIAGRDEAMARANLIHKETELADTNIFQSPLAYYTVARGGDSNISPVSTLHRENAFS